MTTLFGEPDPHLPSADQRVTVLEAYDGLVQLLHGFRDPFYGLVFVASELYYDSFSDDGTPFNNTGTWSQWLEAVSTHPARALATSSLITVEEAYSGVIKLLEMYEFVWDVRQMLPAFRYDVVEDGVPPTTFGWYAYGLALSTRLTSTEFSWRKA